MSALAAPSKRKVGRPTALTPERHEQLIRLVRGGAYLETACAIAGVDSRTVRDWMRFGARPDAKPELQRFRADMIEAVAECEKELVGFVAKAAPADWKAAAWILERRFAGRYGRRDESKVKHEITTPGRVVFVTNGRGPAPAALPSGKDDIEDAEVVDGL